MNIITALQTYLSYSFVRYALIAGVLISLCAALLGVSLVLKRYSMIGDGLSHVAFGAMSIAAVLSLAPMTVAMPVTIVAAVVLLGLNSNGKIKGDAAIAMISVGALALGYLLLNTGKIHIHARDACGSAIRKEQRHHIGNHVHVDIGVHLRIHPGRLAPVDRDIVPAYMLHIVLVIHADVRAGHHLKWLILAVPDAKKP